MDAEGFGFDGDLEGFEIEDENDEYMFSVDEAVENSEMGIFVQFEELAKIVRKNNILQLA